MKTITATLMIIALLLVLVGCTQTSPAPATIPTSETEGNTVVAGSPVQVVIENAAFNPTDVEIKTGSTVEWINQDGFQHTVTFNNGAADEQLPAGASFSHTFSEAGEYTYYCTIHAGMQGKIIVN